MLGRLSRRTQALTLIGAGLLAGGCGKSSVGGSDGGPARALAPVARQGAVSVTTRNTTRVGGASVAVDAAAVARAVYPGLTADSRPRLAVVVDERDWPAALAASALASEPTHAPILYARGNSLEQVSEEALTAMRPSGDAALQGAQVLDVATTAPAPDGLVARSLAAEAPAAAAATLERALVQADGGAIPHQAIVVPLQAPPALQMPAAGLAAESGAPILYASAGALPTETASALAGMRHPSIYVLDPTLVSKAALGELARLGHVTQIAAEGSTAVQNAIAVARFTDGTFGWGVKDPGHGLLFAATARPLDAPAAALLSATADYGPLLVLEEPAHVPAPLSAYLSDIQPAYTSAPAFRPVRGVYNHGWLIGDESAISAVAQAELDSLLEISPRKQSGGEEAVVQSE